MSFTVQDPQPGQWTVEVATARRQHTPYTVGGFVRSPVALRLEVPSLVHAGGVVDVRAAVGDARGGLDGVRVRATVTAPVASSDVFVDKYRERLSRIELPRDYLADGGPDKARAALAQLVLLRDRLREETGEDILAPRIDQLVLGATTLKPGPFAAPLGRLRPQLPGVVEGATGVGTGSGVVVGGRGGVPFPVGSGVGGSGAVGGGVGTGVVGVGGSTTTVDPRRIRVIDPRIVQRPKQTGILSCRYAGTKIPGSHTVTVTATGVSPACGTRFVRKDSASFAVIGME